MRSGAAWSRVGAYAVMTLLIPSLLLSWGFRGRLSRSSQLPGGLTTASRAGVGGTNAKLARQAREAGNSRWGEAYGQRALTFEANKGQSDSRVRFLSHGSGYELFLTDREAVLVLGRSRSGPSSDSSLERVGRTRRSGAEPPGGTASTLRLRLVEAKLAPKIQGLDELPGKSNYFIGNDPENWRTGVPSYGRVKYQGICPGVDLIFYGNQRRLEYDYVVAPGANPNCIAMDVEGPRRLQMNTLGGLVIRVAAGEVQFRKPKLYQVMKGERREIAGRYALAGNHRVTFRVGDYGRNEPLIIDPVLDYSTFLGGSGADTGLGIAVDSLGHAFVTGQTLSLDFPTTLNGFNQGPPNPNPKGAVFVTELNPTGTAEVYSTYLSGDGGETGTAIALDTASPPNAYVTGVTFSTNFPTTANALNPGPLSSNTAGTAFLSKINTGADGVSSLVYSTYLGGTGGDSGAGVAEDSGQNAYVTGLTTSGDFPTTSNAFLRSKPSSPSGNAFVARIDTTKSGGASLIYSTYLGGTGTGNANFPFGDKGFGIAVDSAQNAYVAGTTTSIDFPTTANAFHPGRLLSNLNGLAFVSRIDTTLSGIPSLIYSTYLGGSGGDSGRAIALGPNRTTYVTGSTASGDFPTTAGAFQTVTGGVEDAFVSKIDTSLSGAASLVYSTFLGGSGSDEGSGIAADSSGNAYVTGETGSSMGFKVTPGAFQPTNKNSAGTAFISKLAPAGNGLIYSTFFGGTGNGAAPDMGTSIALDPSNNAYITGSTASADFPIAPNPGAFQTKLNGTSDAFLAKLPLVATVAAAPTSLNFGTQLIGFATAPMTVTLTNNTTATLSLASSINLTAGISGDFSIPPGSSDCGTSLPPGFCTLSVAFKPSISSSETATLNFNDSDPSGPQQQVVSLSGTGTSSAPVALLGASQLNFGGRLLTTTSSATNVGLSNLGNAPLVISQIAITGDFTQTNTCGTPPTVASGKNCTFSITFSPKATGARTGALTLTDNANGSPHSIALSGTGFDYTLTAPSALTVTDGSSGTVTLTVTPAGGFDQTVKLACSGAPALATCKIAPTSVITDGVNPATATVTITTKSGSQGAPHPEGFPPASVLRIFLSLLALALLSIRLAAKRVRARLVLAAGFSTYLVIAGCGGGGPGTPKGNSTLTLTGTSGNVTHSVKFTLTVQ